MANTLFEKYGGFSTVHSIVIEFYNSVLDSDEVGPFFDGTDMDSLIDHQTKFISFLLDGPVSYPEAKLKAAHSSLDIQAQHFDTIKSLLGETLAGFDVEQADIISVLEKIESYRSVIAA